MEIENLKKFIDGNEFSKMLLKLYNKDSNMQNLQKNRYSKLTDIFVSHFGGERQGEIYSVPGRCEIGGNHTDHNNGIVVAAAVDLDVIAIASKNNTNIVNIISVGYNEILPIDISSVEIIEDEKGTINAIVRGIYACFYKEKIKISGIDIVIDSYIPTGVGLSSSAAIEVMLAKIISCEFSNDSFTQIQLAQFGQYAENLYFGKPSGLMDQLSCSVGGVMTIDFKDSNNPTIDKTELDLEKHGLALVIVNSNSSHENLSDEYSQIKNEMCSIAKIFWKDTLREIDYETFFNHIAYIRDQLGDRAVLRGMHYYNECDRAIDIRKAIEAGDINEFLRKIIEGGHSSVEYNQNAYLCNNVNSQGVTVALSVAQSLLQDKRGAWRLQGGGFGGTIQCFVEKSYLNEFIEKMEIVLNENCCNVVSFRKYGAITLSKEM